MCINANINIHKNWIPLFQNLSWGIRTNARYSMLIHTCIYILRIRTQNDSTLPSKLREIEVKSEKEINMEWSETKRNRNSILVPLRRGECGKGRRENLVGDSTIFSLGGGRNPDFLLGKLLISRNTDGRFVWLRWGEGDGWGETEDSGIAEWRWNAACRLYFL